jgi:hypothetical protein
MCSSASVSYLFCFFISFLILLMKRMEDKSKTVGKAEQHCIIS